MAARTRGPREGRSEGRTVEPIEGPEVDIRLAREDELDGIADLIVEAFAEFEPQFPPGLWAASGRDWRDVRGRLPDSELIVASAMDALVGAVTFYPDATRSEAEHWPTGWASIRAMVVRPGWRGRGIGRRLTGECLRRAAESGHPTVGLHTGPFLRAAIAMYEGMGFQRDPAHDVGWLGDRSVPVGTRGSLHAFAFRLDLASEAAGDGDD